VQKKRRRILIEDDESEEEEKTIDKNMAEMFLDDEAVESDLVTSEDELEENDCHSTTSEEEVDSRAAVIENVGKGPP
ncbi:unnamed protein product, partial [Allacma fusca]